MPRSDLNDLAAFVAIADSLSFRAAASRLGVTPSALSHTMRHLEERLGVRLLHRTTRSVAVTDAGQYRRYFSPKSRHLKSRVLPNTSCTRSPGGLAIVQAVA